MISGTLKPPQRVHCIISPCHTVASGGDLCWWCAGIGVKVSGIGLISDSLLLDEGETGDAIERIWLHFEPGIGNLVIAAGTNSVWASMQGFQRLFDPA